MKWMEDNSPVKFKLRVLCIMVVCGLKLEIPWNSSNVLELETRLVRDSKCSRITIRVSRNNSRGSSFEDRDMRPYS